MFPDKEGKAVFSLVRLAFICSPHEMRAHHTAIAVPLLRWRRQNWEKGYSNEAISFFYVDAFMHLTID
jgi:hypothetical protein